MDIHTLITSKVNEHYGLELRLKQLGGELDLNYTGTHQDGQRFIVKLMHAGCAEGRVAYQCAAMQHLASKELPIKLPEVIPSLDGSPFINIEVEGNKRILWILSYCEGTLWADFNPHSEVLMKSFGESIAHLAHGFEGFDHPAIREGNYWEITRSLEHRPLATYIKGPCQQIAEEVFDKFEKKILPAILQLSFSAIHNDANDQNVLVQTNEAGIPKVSAIFDFGDMCWQPIICEIAVALTYALFGQEAPIAAACRFLEGYSKKRDISVEELSVLLDLIRIRLAVSLGTSSYRQIENPNDPYITISQAPAKELLLKLSGISDELALAHFKIACGIPINSHFAAVIHHLQNPQNRPAPIINMGGKHCILDLSAGSSLLGASPKSLELETLTHKVEAYMQAQSAQYGIGRYLEPRRIYTSELFVGKSYTTKPNRCVHLGLDIFCDAGTPVYAPYDGTVEIATINDQELDYGGLIVLRHITSEGHPFFTLYGHLSHQSIEQLQTGQSVKAGEQIAELGEPHENGGWAPHLHLQIILDLLDLGADFPGVCKASEVGLWKALCPNPALLIPSLNPKEINAWPHPEDLLERRRNLLGHNLSLSYKKPLHIVAGYKQFLYDSHGQAYLDVYNNVPHVGHQHPHVVAAIQAQAALLNTNTRYLHDYILQYAERLTAKMPTGLDVCFLVNSASEANELALRLARTYTGRKDMLVVEGAYHGHTSSLIDISPYKFNGPGGKGAPDWVHQVPIPDDYRGNYKRGTENIGALYAQEVQEKLDQLAAQGKQVAAFIAETYPSVGGQIMPPEGYLKNVYEHLRAHGALCIADEVQTGFGRLGDSFWGIDSQEVIPDIVVLGKPIANGFPMGALVTTREIADAFANGMEFFSTFGGNPVACAAGNAVLDVIEAENLQDNARDLGAYFVSELRRMQQQFEVIGDVRGEGFFLGIELVKDRTTLAPDEAATRYVVNRLCEEHILAGVDGPMHNVIKIRPSMVIERRDMEHVVEVMEHIFRESFVS